MIIVGKGGLNMEHMVCGLPEDVLREEGLGNFSRALKLIERYLENPIPLLMRRRLEYEKERIERILEDYPYDEKEALERLKERIPDFTEDEFEKLLEEGLLDYIVVEGERKFEKRFVENLGFALPEYRERMKKDPEVEKVRELLNRRIEALLGGDKPKKYRVRARITLRVEDEREGRFKVWLPFPKEELQVGDVRLVEVSHRDFFLAPNEAPQRTIYMEGEEKEYFVEFEYTIEEWVNKVDPEKVWEEPLKPFLKEEPPHIVFTPYLKWLTESVVGAEENPYLKAKRIYDWITTHVRYSYVRPYSLYENISEFVARNLKGDCGFQALLFITMCRIANVPARWQSGWYANPIFASPHDWALFYVRPYGWLPVDLSFGGARRENERLRNFYFGNLDGFRMVANSDFMKDFVPPTKFVRNDPCDNQVGEVEAEWGRVKFESELRIVSFEEVI